MKKVKRARTQLQFSKKTIQFKQPSKGSKFNNTSRNNSKPIFKVHFGNNSIETIKLFARDFLIRPSASSNITSYSSPLNFPLSSLVIGNNLL